MNDRKTICGAPRGLALMFAGVLFIAFSVRIAAAWVWHDATIDSGRLFRLGDSDSYWVLAGHIARGEAYQYGGPDASIFRAPLYPIVLAPLTLIEDASCAVWWARVLGCACGTVAVALVMRLAGNIGGSRAALLAGCVAALTPGAIGMSIVILSEAIFCPLMLLVLVGWRKAIVSHEMRPVAKLSLLSGVASGLAILARPSWLLFMPLAGTLVLALHPRRGHQLRVLLLMAIGCCAVMSPWWVRNARLTARFVPTTLQVGASLVDGLHEGASGASDENMEFVNHFIAEQQQADAAWADSHRSRQAGKAAETEWETLVARSTFEYRLNARMQQAALEWASKNLSVAFRLSVVKFAKTWSLWPSAGEVGSTGLRTALTLGCLGVLACAVTASWMLARESAWSVAVCWMPAVYFTLLHMVFVGSIRYREPAILVLTALAGCALGRLPIIERWTRKSFD